jgi:hypothetical protein
MLKRTLKVPTESLTLSRSSNLPRPITSSRKKLINGSFDVLWALGATLEAPPAGRGWLPP